MVKLIRTTGIIIFLILVFTADSIAQCEQCQYQTELVTNGNFSQGNTGFSTTLNYVTGIFGCPLCPENTYTVGASAIFYHSGFNGNDHTNPPFGNFFIANAQGQSNTAVWCMNTPVQPNTDYTFSYWYRDVTNNNNPHPLAWLQVSWNGELEQDTAIAAGGWQQFITTWNSGSSTTLNLCIVNQQWQTGGNDFGLDDISLTACHDYQLSQQAFAGDDSTICSEETFSLGQPSLNGYNYQWTGGSGLSSSTISNPTFQVFNQGVDPVEYEFILTTDSAGVGCVTADTVRITVVPVPDLQITGNTVICPGETTILDAGAGWEEIIWSEGSSTQQIAVVGGVFSAQTFLGECVQTDTVAIVVTPMPELFAADALVLCETEVPYQLDAGVVAAWSSGQSAEFIDVIDSGLYSATYSESGCTVTDQILIEVFTMPTPVISGGTYFCEQSSIMLTSTISGTWSNGENSNQIEVFQPGVFTMTVTNGPCVATTAVDIAELELPEADLGPDIEVCEDQPVELSASASQNQTYVWSDGSTEPELVVNQSGEFWVEVSNPCGVIRDTIEVSVYPCSWDLFIPNAFSPNNDGINDTWFPQGFNYSNASIKVYNRLGDMIYFSDKPGEVWQPDMAVGQDVYNYLIEATDYSGNPVVRTGHIYLLR